ncbi:MAG: hypothetical protein ACE5R4_07090 [Armatimonadota bacterium]
MKHSPLSRACIAAYLAGSLLLVLAMVQLLGCEGAPSPGVGSLYGYAYEGSLVCTCSVTPPPGYVPAVGYYVYVDDPSGPPDAITGADGYWVVTPVTAGLHTIHICPPGGPPGCLSFTAVAMSGMFRCQASHDAGGG